MNGSSKPSSYKELDCCKNCRTVFVLAEIDCETRYFCMKNSPTRSPCGTGKEYFIVISVDDWAKEHGFSHEDLFGPSRKINEYDDFVRPKIRAMHDAWREWSKNREVEAYGKCNEWEKFRIIDRPGIKFKDLENMNCPFSKPYDGCKEEWEKNET